MAQHGYDGKHMSDPVVAFAAGRVAGRDLLDVLRLFNRCQMTGVLRLDGAAHKAQIHMRSGGLRAAFYNDQVGVGALTRAILAGEAEARFEPLPSGVPRNIPHETGFVLDSIAKVLVDVESAQADKRAISPRSTHASEGPSTERITNFAPPEPGTLLGRCRLTDEIGRGASSVVYRAHHLAMDVDVVVKVLMQAGGGSHHRQLTINEARLLARLNHPNIVRLFDFDDSGSFPYLVVELIDGPGLNRVLRDIGAMTALDAVTVFTQVAEALSYAHDRMGLVHCDLKPDNILLTKERQAKLADLGTARSRISKAEVAGESVVVGTPSYIPPELVQGGHAGANMRSDIYSFGASLYHAVAGRPPFLDDDPIQLMIKRLNNDPEPVTRLAPNLDAGLGVVIMSMLQRAPEARPADWDEVLDRLGECEARLRDERVIRRRSAFWRGVPGMFRREG